VRVVPGNADPLPGKATPASTGPLPRLRPSLPGETAARAYAPEERRESPTSIQLNAPLNLLQ
jgi:hypothetical protein